MSSRSGVGNRATGFRITDSSTQLGCQLGDGSRGSAQGITMLGKPSCNRSRLLCSGQNLTFGTRRLGPESTHCWHSRAEQNVALRSSGAALI